MCHFRFSQCGFLSKKLYKTKTLLVSVFKNLRKTLEYVQKRTESAAGSGVKLLELI